jgi:tetratricopeptide (TPR) repeat protein
LGRQLQHQPEIEAEIRALIGGTYGSLSLPSMAESHLKTALQLRRRVFGESHPKVAQSLLQCAWNANGRSDFAGAESYTRRALAIVREQGDPHSLFGALISLHNFLNQQRRYQEADATGAEALELAHRGGPKQDAAISLILSNSAYSQLGLGRHAEAERLAREALDLSIQVHGPDHPRNVPFYDCLLVALQAQGKYDEAEAAGRSALELVRKHYGPRHASTAGMLRRLGALLEAKRDYSGAEAVYLEALPIAMERVAEEPAEATHRSLADAIRWELAAVYTKQGLREKAVEVWSRLIDTDPADAEAWYRRAEFHRRWLRQWDHAVADYEKALELDPSRTDAREGLAYALVIHPEPERRDPGRAIQLASEALDVAPDEGYYWNTLAQAYYRAGRYSDAIEALRESLARRPDDDGLDYIFLAMTHWQLGDKEQARRYYDQGSQWIEQKQPKTEEFRRFQAEAEELMGINRDKRIDN